MRSLLPSRFLRLSSSRHVSARSALRGGGRTAVIVSSTPPVELERYNSVLNNIYFNGTAPRASLQDVQQSGGKPPDERTLKLGKTIREIHERLPTLLEKPLPQDILAPRISLHLFPSTHPHLPAVSGKLAYTGALWTAPVAWGRIPVVGNVKIQILSERMFRNSGITVSQDCRDEKLIVKWKTCSGGNVNRHTIYRGMGPTEQLDALSEAVRGRDKDDAEFCGLFIFEFDDQGRISKHTIEHAEEGGNCDRALRFASVTDWLLGKAPWKRREEAIPGLAWCEDSGRRNQSRFPLRRSEHET